MARTRRRRIVGRGPKRNLFWARASVELDSSDTGSHDAGGCWRSFNLLSNFQDTYGANLFGFTVTRTIIELANWEGDRATQALVRNSWGIRISDSDEVENAASEWRQLVPLQDEFADWMWVHNWSSVSGVGTSREVGYRKSFDIKSQRKLSELGQHLMLYAGRNTQDPGWTHADVHLLLKQP